MGGGGGISASVVVFFSFFFPSKVNSNLKKKVEIRSRVPLIPCRKKGCEGLLRCGLASGGVSVEQSWREKKREKKREIRRRRAQGKKAKVIT